MSKVRLIDANTLREQIDNYNYFYSSFEKMTVAEFLTIVHEFIDNAPTVPQTIITEFKGCDNCELERPQGEWKPFDLTFGRSIYYCSECKNSLDLPIENGKPLFNFCPNCGAKMQKGNAV